jgi:RHS repeat-associated protein
LHSHNRSVPVKKNLFFHRKRGGRKFFFQSFFFELVNHLGNVLVTVSDKKNAIDDGTYTVSGQGVYTKVNSTPDGKIDYYIADIKSAQDFYPFGFKMPGRKFSATSYRYGFNGKEESDEVYDDGNIYDYGFRIYNPRISKFLSVDPLMKQFPWYTPYQFAGNKPIAFVDLDGREEDYYMPVEVDVAGIWNDAVDGLGNVALRINEWMMPDFVEGRLIRTGLERANIPIPPNITNKELGANFQMYKEDRTFKVRGDQSVLKDVVDVMIGALDVAAVVPTKGSGPMLMMKTSGVTNRTISELLKGLSLNKKIKEFKNTIDPATGKFMRETEAETAALLDDALGGVRALKETERGGDVIGKAGKYWNKSIDILNPAEAVAKGKFNIEDFYKSIDSHLLKSTDYTAIDVRSLAGDQIAAIEKYVSNLSDVSKGKIMLIKK